jgi:ribosome-binding protein aMBF1 (putative translation factor)
MMLLLLQDRKDNSIHLVDWTNRNGKWTLCGTRYPIDTIVNVLAVDNSVRNVCPKCYEVCERDYILPENPGEFPRFCNISRMSRRRQDKRFGDPRTKEKWKYSDLDERAWEKLSLYKRLTTSRKKSVKR